MRQHFCSWYVLFPCPLDLPFPNWYKRWLICQLHFVDLKCEMYLSVDWCDYFVLWFCHFMSKCEKSTCMQYDRMVDNFKLVNMSYKYMLKNTKIMFVMSNVLLQTCGLWISLGKTSNLKRLLTGSLVWLQPQRTSQNCQLTDNLVWLNSLSLFRNNKNWL